jgi:hypothetical protein
MKKILLTLIFFSIFQSLQAQNEAKDRIEAMNKLLNDFSPTQNANLSMITSSGNIEQNFEELIQRYRLAEIGEVLVTKKEKGFQVAFNCKDSGKCVNMVRENINSVNLLGTSYFFSIDAAANTFAENAHELIKFFQGKDAICYIKLFTNDNGKTNRLKVNITNPQATKSVTVNNEADPDQKLNENHDKKINPVDNKKVTPPQNNNDSNEDFEEPKPSNAKIEKPIPDIENEIPPNKKENEFCNQIMDILQAQKKQFKTIEGKVTHADKKINESLAKLKGAKRSYLTQYKNQRAFIAEFRISSELELMNDEFDKLQTQIENCLPGNWDDIDHSEDEEYANITEQVRDIEYINQDKQQIATIRITMFYDGKKYIQFVRIK